MHMHAMEYYSVIKKNKIISFVGKWMELEIIMLNEISQAQKDKYHVFFICGTLSEMMMMTMGHEYILGTVWRGDQREARGRKGY
jgi:hypothetical protein